MVSIRSVQSLLHIYNFSIMQTNSRFARCGALNIVTSVHILSIR